MKKFNLFPVLFILFIFLIGVSNVEKVNAQVVSSSLSIPTVVVNNSTASQYLAVGNTVGLSNATKIDFNFVSNGGTSTIREIKFFVSGTKGTTRSIMVNGLSVVVGPNGLADLTGLNIPILSGTGTDVIAFVSYSPVGVNGVSSGSTSTVQLGSVKYLSSNGSAIALNDVLVTAPTMTLVDSKPTLNLSADGSLTTGMNVLVGTITVSADSAGNIAFQQIPITTSINVGTNGSFSSFGAPYITDPSIGVYSLPNVTYNCSATQKTNSCLAIWNAGSHYIIQAGQSKSFNVYETILGNLGTGASVSLGLGSPSNFLWNDISGLGTVNLNGVLIYAYPTNTVSIHN